MELDITTPWIGPVSVCIDSIIHPLITLFSVHFPGAVNSKFVTKFAFERPSTHSAIPTYRVMDSDGIVVDEGKKPSDLDPEEVVKWYKNMLTG